MQWKLSASIAETKVAKVEEATKAAKDKVEGALSEAHKEIKSL